MAAIEKLGLPAETDLFENAFHYAAIGMALVSARGEFLKVNQALCQMLGMTDSSLLHTDFQSLTHPEDLDTDLSRLAAMLDGRIDSYQMEKRYRHARGHYIWALLSVSLIRDNQGEPVHFISQIQDISERKASEEQLCISTARLETLVNNLSVGLLLEDEEHRILMVNNTFCDLLTLPCWPRDLIGTDCRDMADDMSHLFARPEFLQSRLNEILRNRRPIRGETVELADGRVLERDYLPVFVDDVYRGHLWSYREIRGQRHGAGR
jgi:two-component system, sporulation sensor kinase E